jgi:hypothetical protein
MADGVEVVALKDLLWRELVILPYQRPYRWQALPLYEKNADRGWRLIFLGPRQDRTTGIALFSVHQN